MPTHSAKSLFDLNIQSAEECMQLHAGIERLRTQLEISWLLRASVVFSISAMDAYFHDKIKYRAGHSSLTDLPPAMARFQIPLSELPTWEQATRKGNVLRNWLVDHFSTRPLQKTDDIADALKIAGIQDLWATIEPNTPDRDLMFTKLRGFVTRRNQIAHEGDRESSRRSGKRLRPIDRNYAQECIDFIKDLVGRVETAFPR